MAGDRLLWRAFGMSTGRLDLAFLVYMRSTAAAAAAALHRNTAVSKALVSVQEACLLLVTLESGGLQRVSCRPYKTGSGMLGVSTI